MNQYIHKSTANCNNFVTTYSTLGMLYEDGHADAEITDESISYSHQNHV